MADAATRRGGGTLHVAPCIRLRLLPLKGIVASGVT